MRGLRKDCITLNQSKKDLLTCGALVVVKPELDSALLEYRRQHNIYEVGDYVILNVGSRVYKIDHIYKKSVWLDSGKETLDIVNIDDISGHATDLEIQAGKRLEVKA